ncbi:MAG: UDP-N-acetylmuramoyl-tripeptide--D-alanyl-D-alanine ligase [Chitinophagaceae bacterium]
MNIEELYQLYLQFPSIQTDTRKLQPDDLFFALKGPNFNGNEFAQKAIDGGAAFAIVDEAQFAGSEKIIVVNDVLETLQQLATHHRLQYNIPFIGITGTNGKTTTKELIHVVLSATYKTYTTTGNLNNHIGVPLTLLKVKKDAEMAVIEMGANHIGEIASYCRIALPTHGLITNCGKAHLEGFGSEESVKKGKGELYDHLRNSEGTVFVMWDYDYLKTMSNGIQKIITYGTRGAEITGHSLKSDPFLKVKFDEGFKGVIQTNLVGDYNLPNVLAALAVGKFFNVPEEKIRAAISNYYPSNSRSQLLQKGTNKIILDAYNANPTSMKVAIENLAKAREANKILVLGAMAELGESSLQEHKAIMNIIEKYSWKEVLLVGGDFVEMDHKYLQFASSEDAGKWLQQNKIHNSYLLIKGSRSMQMEKILDYI